MSRKLVVLAAALAGCAASWTVTPSLAAEALRDGCVTSTLDALLGSVDLFARAAEAEDPDGIRAALASCAADLDAAGVVVACADARVGGEIVTLHATLEPVGGSLLVAIEAEGACRTGAALELRSDPELGVAVEGTLRTESADGTVVDCTLERVFVRPVADLPDVESGAVFVSGNVDFEVYADGQLLATGTAALFGRSALVALSADGATAEGEIDLGR